MLNMIQWILALGILVGLFFGIGALAHSRRIQQLAMQMEKSFMRRFHGGGMEDEQEGIQ